MSWKIEFYKAETGTECVKEFLDTIENPKLKAKVLQDIKLLKEFGTELRSPHTDYLGDQ